MTHPRKSITRQRKQTSHTTHLILTILTGGLWGIFVWFPLTVWHKAGPKQKIVTRFK